MDNHTRPPAGGHSKGRSASRSLSPRLTARRLGRLLDGGRFPRPPWGGQARPPHGLNGLCGAPHPTHCRLVAKASKQPVARFKQQTQAYPLPGTKKPPTDPQPAVRRGRPGCPLPCPAVAGAPAPEVLWGRSPGGPGGGTPRRRGAP